MPGRSDAIIRLTWAAATDTGHRRAANEDSYIAQSPVFAVADGMGGHSAGDLASAAVVTRLAEVISQGFATTESIDRALEKATDDIDQVGDERQLGVGTTVTGAVLTLQAGEPYFAVFNIGDSRVYQFERNELRQVTVDHSVVQEMVEQGLISREQAEHHPDSNVITRAVGFNMPPTADYWMLPLRPGFRLLICSDGLTKELGDERIRLHMAAGLSATETSHALVDAALAAGGRDNITTIVLDVVDAPSEFELHSTAPRSGGTSV
nr:protein phosphatase 2C domain-containing protein [Galbitalea soli]